MYSANQVPSPWLGMTPEQKQQMLLAQNSAAPAVDPNIAWNPFYIPKQPVQKAAPVAETPSVLPNLNPAGVDAMASAFKKKKGK